VGQPARKHKPDVQTIHTLYRLFAADDTLLYIGITGNLMARLGFHNGKQPWWAEVATATFTTYATRADLEDAEIVAIVTEKPKHNKKLNRRRCSCKTVATPSRVKVEQRTPTPPLDRLAEFLARRCEAAPGAWDRHTQSSVLFKAWAAYCAEQGVDPGTNMALTQNLLDRGFGKKKGPEGHRIVGISLLDVGVDTTAA
jgi:predicted GIY-YIG superfamily endonuclease